MSSQEGDDEVVVVDEGAVGPEAAKPTPKQQQGKTLTFLKELRNVTREEGESLRLRCEVAGSPPATEIRWLKYGVPIMEERSRVKVRTRLKGDPQWSQLRFAVLKTLDTAFYGCEASNGVDTINSSAILKVNMGQRGGGAGGRGGWSNRDDYDDEEGLLPETYSEPGVQMQWEFQKCYHRINNNYAFYGILYPTVQKLCRNSFFQFSG